jgi:hypothetical protein
MILPKITTTPIQQMDQGFIQAFKPPLLVYPRSINQLFSLPNATITIVINSAI